MAVEIRDFTHDEATAFLAREWAPYNEALGIAWDVRDIVLVATEGEPVGVARGVVIGGVGELKELLVRKDHAERGIGSRLLIEFEARCRALECHKLRLETAEYQARPFYERHGFVAAVTLSGDRFGRDWYVMEKRVR